MRTAAIGGLLLGLVSGPAAAQEGPQSTALAITARFTAAGVRSQIRPIAAVSGAMSRTYDASQTVAEVHEDLAIASGDPTPTLSVTGSRLTSHASARGRGGGREALGENTLTNLRLALVAHSSTGQSGVSTSPALTVDARELASSAYFNGAAKARGGATGLMNVGALSISGQLVGDAILKRSGQVAPNTVVYSSPQLSITLNRQIESGVVSCDDEDCTETPLAVGVGVIQVIGIDIELHGALVGATKVNGQIRVGQVTAQ